MIDSSGFTYLQQSKYRGGITSNAENLFVTALLIAKMKNPPEKGIEKKRELVINY